MAAEASVEQVGISARRRRLSSLSTRRTIAFYGFIAPWLVGFVLLGIIPLVVGLLTSMTNYDGMNVDTLKFLGLRNYGAAFQDKDMIFSLERTALWSALNTPMWICASFVLALILNQAGGGRDLFRTLYYLPSVVPVVATARIWVLFYDTNNGLLNGIISLFRPGTAIRWFSDFALFSLATISVWGGLGGGMVIFLAGLQGIPVELEEAALIDGANKLRVFRHVTIPLMTPVIFFQLIMALIGSLQAFALPMLIYGGGHMGSTPPRPVYLYVVHTYRHIFAFQRFGYGTALLWLLFVLILALTLVVFRSARYWVHYEEAVEGAAE
jgi:multiple sugar transport system permease protein